LEKNRVEYLIGYEGNMFAFTGNIKEDLLSITAVHPMREDAIEELLKKANANWQIINELLYENKLTIVKYQGKKYYMRKIK
jgi:wyosine [tRNA(Phe)-imidazoG37] synthetase (radical SAM superfamily)